MSEPKDNEDAESLGEPPPDNSLGEPPPDNSLGEPPPDNAAKIPDGAMVTVFPPLPANASLWARIKRYLRYPGW